MDTSGTFLGSVGPGEGALLSIPDGLPTVLAVSSVDVTANVGSWFFIQEVVVPPAPNGIVLETTRRDARQCGNGHYAGATIATKAELEAVLGEKPLRCRTSMKAKLGWTRTRDASPSSLAGSRSRVRVSSHARTFPDPLASFRRT